MNGGSGWRFHSTEPASVSDSFKSAPPPKPLSYTPAPCLSLADTRLPFLPSVRLRHPSLAPSTRRKFLVFGANIGTFRRAAGPHGDGAMTDPAALTGRHVRLEPVTPAHREEMRAALDCDADNWAIQIVSAQGPNFEGYWAAMLATPGRLAYAVRVVDPASPQCGRLAGTSSLLFVDGLVLDGRDFRARDLDGAPLPGHRTVEIGSTWFRPEFRGQAVNPEVKLLMLGEAFRAGAERVALRVDARNARSQAAIAKLGAVREGVMRRSFITWTGHKRDTVVYSIVAEEWLEVRARLEARVAGHSS